MVDQRQQTWHLVSARNRHFAKQAIDRAPENWECVIKPPKRSLEQNRRLHSMLNAIIAHRVKWAGKEWDIDSWRHIFLSAWFIEKQDEPPTAIPGLAGEFVMFHRASTTTLTTAEFGELMAYIESKIAEWAVPWFPDEAPLPEGY